MVDEPTLADEQRNTIAWARGRRDYLDDKPRGGGHKGKGFDDEADTQAKLNAAEVRDEALARRVLALEMALDRLTERVSALELKPDHSGGYGPSAV